MKTTNFWNSTKVFFFGLIHHLAVEMKRSDRIYREVEARKTAARLDLISYGMFPK
jgi:hypothetical protein